MAASITSWSFSRLQTYNECPLKARYKFIDKLPEPSSPALERGTALHLLAEYYLRGIRKTVPTELKAISEPLKNLRKCKALAEAEFAFDKDWNPVTWFDKKAWCRVKADSTIPPVIDDEATVFIDDFKSGGRLDAQGNIEFKQDYPLQLELYGIAGLITYPAADQARSSLIFIDHGKTVETEPVHRKDLPALKKAWEKRIKKMLADQQFKPTPGSACRWCTFRRSNGGPCQY